MWLYLQIMHPCIVIQHISFGSNHSFACYLLESFLNFVVIYDILESALLQKMAIDQ